MKIFSGGLMAVGMLSIDLSRDRDKMDDDLTANVIHHSC